MRKTSTPKNPTLVYLTAGELEICEKVQRQVELAHARKLSKNWDDALVGVLTVSYRDGHFYVVDGQQRLYVQTAIKKDRDYRFMVNLWEGLSEQEEGQMFLAMNRDHKSVTTYDRFKVAANIGSADELAVLKAIEDLGYTIGPKSSAEVIGCPATLLRIYRQTGRSNLKRAIEIYAAAFRGDDKPWNATVLEGIALLFHKDGHRIEDARAISKFRVQWSEDFDREARARAVGNNRAVGAMVRVLQEHYDKGLRANNRLFTRKDAA